MSADNLDLEISLGAETAPVEKLADSLSRIKGIARELESEGTASLVKFGVGLGILEEVGAKVVHSIMAIPQGFEHALRSGVQFNAQLEAMRISMAAVLRQFNPDLGSFDEALLRSGKVMDTLREKANKFGLSFHEIADTYQTTIGAMAGVGIKDIGTQIDLTIMLTKAMAAMGATGFTATRDIQDIMLGMGQRTKAGRELGVDDNAFKAADDKAAYLFDKFKAYSESGAVMVNTFKGQMNVFHNAIEQLEGAVAKPIFDVLRDSLIKLNVALRDPEIISQLKHIGVEISHLIEFGGDLLVWAVKNADALVNIARAAGLVSVALTAIKLKSLILDLGLSALGWAAFGSAATNAAVATGTATGTATAATRAATAAITTTELVKYMGVYNSAVLATARGADVLTNAWTSATTSAMGLNAALGVVIAAYLAWNYAKDTRKETISEELDNYTAEINSPGSVDSAVAKLRAEDPAKSSSLERARRKEKFKEEIELAQKAEEEARKKYEAIPASMRVGGSSYALNESIPDFIKQTFVGSFGEQENMKSFMAKAELDKAVQNRQLAESTYRNYDSVAGRDFKAQENLQLEKDLAKIAEVHASTKYRLLQAEKEGSEVAISGLKQQAELERIIAGLREKHKGHGAHGPETSEATLMKLANEQLALENAAKIRAQKQAADKAEGHTQGVSETWTDFQIRETQVLQKEYADLLKSATGMSVSASNLTSEQMRTNAAMTNSAEMYARLIGLADKLKAIEEAKRRILEDQAQQHADRVTEYKIESLRAAGKFGEADTMSQGLTYEKLVRAKRNAGDPDPEGSATLELNDKIALSKLQVANRERDNLEAARQRLEIQKAVLSGNLQEVEALTLKFELQKKIRELGAAGNPNPEKAAKDLMMVEMEMRLRERQKKQADIRENLAEEMSIQRAKLQGNDKEVQALQRKYAFEHEVKKLQQDGFSKEEATAMARDHQNLTNALEDKEGSKEGSKGPSPRVRAPGQSKIGGATRHSASDTLRVTSLTSMLGDGGHGRVVDRLGGSVPTKAAEKKAPKETEAEKSTRILGEMERKLTELVAGQTKLVRAWTK